MKRPKTYRRTCPRCAKAYYHWPYERVIPHCPTCNGRGKIRVKPRKKRKVKP